MKRALTPSEKRLMILCGGLIVFVTLLFTWRDYQSRMAAAREKIEELEPQLLTTAAAEADASFWEERGKWLDATMPVLTDVGQAHSGFLEHLLETARQRGLTLTSPVLQKPEAGPHYRDLSITLQFSGPDSSTYRWLAELQSPEKFQVIKHLQLSSQSAQPPRMSGNLTVARLFKP